MANSNAKLDQELKKAFNELQLKMVESSKKIQLIDSQLGTLNRILKHIEITEHEISALPPETRTYEALGRCFMLNDINSIKKNLNNRQTSVTTRSTELEKSKQYLEKGLKESEDNIRELVQQRKSTEPKPE